MLLWPGGDNFTATISRKLSYSFRLQNLPQVGMQTGFHTTFLVIWFAMQTQRKYIMIVVITKTSGRFCYIWILSGLLMIMARLYSMRGMTIIQRLLLKCCQSMVVWWFSKVRINFWLFSVFGVVLLPFSSLFPLFFSFLPFSALFFSFLIFSSLFCSFLLFFSLFFPFLLFSSLFLFSSHFFSFFIFSSLLFFSLSFPSLPLPLPHAFLPLALPVTSFPSPPLPPLTFTIPPYCFPPSFVPVLPLRFLHLFLPLLPVISSHPLPVHSFYILFSHYLSRLSSLTVRQLTPPSDNHVFSLFCLC